jgi:hypothetical protein
MKSVPATVSGFIAIALAAPGLWAASAQKTEVQAQLLDHNEYQCSNCFFGTSSYYFCFAAGDKTLIGFQKMPELNWKEHSSNLLTRVHKQWKPWVSEGQSVPLSYDDKSIWVTRPDGKQVKLKQDYGTDIFINSSQCRSAVKKKSE